MDISEESIYKLLDISFQESNYKYWTNWYLILITSLCLLSVSKIMYGNLLQNHLESILERIPQSLNSKYFYKNFL